MSTCYQTWNTALKAPQSRPLFGERDIRPLALELQNALIKREQGYAQCEKCERACDEKTRLYLAACREVIKEGEDLKRKLAKHPKAFQVVDDFLDLITTEGQWELGEVEALGLTGQNRAALILKKWDTEIVPNVKKHGLVPLAVIGASRMHARLLSVVKLYPTVQAAKQAEMGANTQANRLDRIFVAGKIDALLQRVKVWRNAHQSQAAIADAVTKALTELNLKVRGMKP